MVWIYEDLARKVNVPGIVCNFMHVYTDKIGPPKLPWVRRPLKAGKTAHPYCTFNKLKTPFTVPDDMDLYILGYWVSADQKAQTEWFWNGMLAFSMFTKKSGWQYEFGGFKQSTLDLKNILPRPYTIDFAITNVGGKKLSGTFVAYGLLIKIAEL